MLNLLEMRMPQVYEEDMLGDGSQCGFKTVRKHSVLLHKSRLSGNFRRYDTR